MTAEHAPYPEAADAQGRVATVRPFNALAVDTTSDYLSLALLAGGRPAGDCYEALGRGITQAILPRIDALFQEAGLRPAALDAVLVARGPGSFTGTRIGLGVALTFAQLTGCPAVGVDALRLLASQADAGEGQAFHVLLNCARDEVYHAPYLWKDGHPHAAGEIALEGILPLAERLGETPVVLRRFRPGGPRADADVEAAFARLRPLPLRHAQPDAWRLMEQGLLDMHAGAGGERVLDGVPRVEPLYLKSEAFRTWRPAP